MRCSRIFGALLTVVAIAAWRPNAVAAAGTQVEPGPSNMAATLQRTLDHARVASRAPGVSAAIARDGRVIWRGQSGVVNRKTGAPVTASTLFSLASTTKMFVAVMTLRLVEEGRLGLDQPIATLLPGYVPDTSRVTVRELLGHTSGYPDVEGDARIIAWLADPNHVWERSQLLRLVRPVTFKPGSRYRYCNSCYVMLGGVVEAAAGETVGAAFDDLIVDRLGLRGETVFDRLAHAAPRIAHGYNGKALDDTFAGARLLGVPTSVWGPMWTDGGLAGTASGVARFTDALFGGHILRSRTLAMMIAPGPDHSYGLGTFRIPFDGHTWQGHDGFYNGFTSVSMYDFSRRLTITVATNLTNNRDPGFEIWDALAKAFDDLS